MAPKRPKIPGNCTQNIVIGYNHEDLSTNGRTKPTARKQ